MVRIRLVLRAPRFGSDVRAVVELSDFDPPLTVEEARRKCEELMERYPGKVEECEVVP